MRGMPGDHAKDFRHKNIRLASARYRGRRWYFVTICCQNRRPLFTSAARAQWLLKYLQEKSRQCAFSVHAYCLMPDHLHILAEGQTENSDLIRFVEAFKQKTGHLYRARTGHTMWQKKYYDHIVRRAASVDAIAWYIWMNPVRKGFCKLPREFPYSGSFTQTIEMLRPMESDWHPPWKRHL